MLYKNEIKAATVYFLPLPIPLPFIASVFTICKTEQDLLEFSTSSLCFFAHLYSDLFAIDTVRFSAFATAIAARLCKICWFHADFNGMQQRHCR